MIFRYLFLLLIALASSAQARQEFVGTVSYVTDGDTIWVQPDAGGRAHKIRILGIDAPEICQQAGKAAREFMQQLALQRRVTVRVVSYDRYGRGLATIALDSGDLGAQMVRAGQAWSYGWRGRPGPYEAEEARARQARLGLFAVGNPESSRAFRKRHGSCHVA